MKVLAFDTALFGCSVAVLDTETNTITQDSRAMARGQAEVLVPMADAVLKKSETEYADLGVIATTIGPGAFTGLRIGLSTARALGLSLDKPVIGLTTLEILAAQYHAVKSLPEGTVLAILLETKRKDFYMQIFGNEETAPEALAQNDIYQKLKGKEAVFIGDALERFREASGKEIDPSWSFVDGYELIDTGFMARLAAKRYGDGDVSKAEPLYLRGADVSKPKRKPREIVK